MLIKILRFIRSAVLNLLMLANPQIGLKPSYVPPNQILNHLRTPKLNFYISHANQSQYHLKEIRVMNRFTVYYPDLYP